MSILTQEIAKNCEEQGYLELSDWFDAYHIIILDALKNNKDEVQKQ